MSPPLPEFVYVADPMCSWCWGFAAVLARLEPLLPAPATWLMGGLAPDSTQPMDESTRTYVQGAWQAVARATGAEFNHDFWTTRTPRRSTYPACRLVIAAERQGRGRDLFHRLQRGFYLEARDPSDSEELRSMASDLEPTEDGLDLARLESDWTSDAVAVEFEAQRDQVARLSVTGFPTLVAVRGSELQVIARGYATYEDCLSRI